MYLQFCRLILVEFMLFSFCNSKNSHEHSQKEYFYPNALLYIFLPIISAFRGKHLQQYLLFLLYLPQYCIEEYLILPLILFLLDTFSKKSREKNMRKIHILAYIFNYCNIFQLRFIFL